TDRVLTLSEPCSARRCLNCHSIQARKSRRKTALKIREYNQHFNTKQQKRFNNFMRVRDEHLRFKNTEIRHKYTEIYRKDCITFLKFYAKNTNKNSLKAVNNKNIQDYMNVRSYEVSITTHKRELSRIRKLLKNHGTHKKITQNNKDINIENRSYITREEKDAPPVASKKDFISMVQEFNNMGDHQSSNIIKLEALMGLRVEEATALRKDQLIQAVTENKMTIYNTKGGKTREVNVSNVAHRQIKNMLNNEYKNLKYSEKLFSKKSG